MKSITKLEAPARHWIDGSWVGSGKESQSINPSTGEVIGHYSDGGRSEAELAVTAARKAFDEGTWAGDRQLRSKALFELAQRLEDIAPTIAQMLSREIGKTKGDGQLEASFSPQTLRYNAGLALSNTGIAAEAAPGIFATTSREPIGVAGLIVPWNSPLALLVRALGPALAAGCTTVVKMPGQSAMTNALIAQAVAETESLPKGVVNIFTESGNEGAPFLIESPDVDAINYTGSTKVGREIARKAGASLKRICLELGGKTPLLIFADTDLDAVAPLVVEALTKFNGQFCMTGSRLLVERSVADAWRTRIATLLEQVIVGPVEDEQTQMGPVIDKASMQRIDRFVEDAARYARIIVRGGPLKEAKFSGGSFYRPSMLETEALDVPLIQEEIFGPVLSFETFADETEAIARANATEFGLAAAVFTRDIHRARRVSRALKAGTVWTNGWAYINDAFEEGGFRQSGLGRSRGAQGIEEFQEIKTNYEFAAAN